MKLRTSQEKDGFPIVVHGATFTVSVPSATRQGQLRTANTAYKRGVPVTDSVGFSKDLFEEYVKGWGPEVQDQDGNPMECTRQNKRLVCEYNMGLASDVMEKADAEEEARRKSEEGNSLPGQSGTSPKAK